MEGPPYREKRRKRGILMGDCSDEKGREPVHTTPSQTGDLLVTGSVFMLFFIQNSIKRMQ